MIQSSHNVQAHGRDPKITRASLHRQIMYVLWHVCACHPSRNPQKHRPNANDTRKKNHDVEGRNNRTYNTSVMKPLNRDLVNKGVTSKNRKWNAMETFYPISSEGHPSQPGLVNIATEQTKQTLLKLDTKWSKSQGSS